MASRAVKALRFTVAWLLVPAAFAATGYYVIGPRLGAPTSNAEPAPTPGGNDGPADEDPPSKSFTAPKIEVSVKKGSTVSQREIRRPPRKKRKPATKPAAPLTDTPTTAPVTSPPTGGGETIPVGDGT